MKKVSLFKVLLKPHITNKSYSVSNKSPYVTFKVLRFSNKLDIKRSVEKLFNVKVDSIKIINVKCRKCNFGGIKGKTKFWKKAYIKLCKGHDINFIGSE